MLPCAVALRVLLGLFSALEGEHLSRLMSEKGRVEASEIGVVDLGLSETKVLLRTCCRNFGDNIS